MALVGMRQRRPNFSPANFLVAQRWLTCHALTCRTRAVCSTDNATSDSNAVSMRCCASARSASAASRSASARIAAVDGRLLRDTTRLREIVLVESGLHQLA